MALMLKMAFQVVEFTLNSENKVLDRKVIPYRYMTLKDAVDAIENVLPTLSASGYERNGNCWSAVTDDGNKRVIFEIESV